MQYLQDELGKTQCRASELDWRLKIKSDEADLLRNFAIRVREERHEALLREELAQGMMIGAEKRLRDKEAEYTKVLMWSRQMMENHTKEVARLKADMEAQMQIASGMAEERTRLVAKIKEIQSQIEGGYICEM